MGTFVAMMDRLVGVDLGWLVKIFSLAALPFAHEDFAIVLGGYIIVNKLMPTGIVIASIYFGMVVSDFALYGIGAGARRLPWLQRFAVDDKVHRFGGILKRNIFSIVALCRLVPGVVFFAFIACGWMRVSFTRFTVATIIVSALYLPLMLYLVIMFGDALDDHAGMWAWPILFIGLAAAGFLRQKVLAFQDEPAVEAAAAAPALATTAAFDGFPALAPADRKLAAAERIPPFLFYLPLVLNWIWLGLRYRSLTLPSCANPTIPTGGMWGESKSACLADVKGPSRNFVADFIVLRRREDPATLSFDVDRAISLLDGAGLAFPVIAKPDIGWHGYGVRLVEDADGLRRYMESFPAGEQLILQRYVPFGCEAAVLYARLPGAARGRVLSIALRYFPHVVGDGHSTLRTLIRADKRARWKAELHLSLLSNHSGPERGALDRVPASGEIVRLALIANQRAGALYRDGHHCLTSALDDRIDEIARSMTEFHYGRFDIRFESLDQFKRGEDFSIVEVNGIGSEAIDAWDPKLTVSQVYRRFVDQQRILFMIGALNRERGFQPDTPGQFIGRLVHQTDLLRRYPPSC